MNSKIYFMFVVLLMAISFVHSFPKLSGENAENAQLAKLMSLMQSFNTTSIQAKLKAKSDESGEAMGVDGYIDTFFVLFFDEDDSSEENTDLAFGHQFDPVQFFALLNADIDKAYQRKCKKISGSDDTYSKIKAADKEMGRCLKNFVKSEEIRTVYTNLTSVEDIHSLINILCRKRAVPIKCIDNYMEVDAQCSYRSEIEFDNSVRRLVHSLLDLTCANDGNDLISLISGQGRQCVMENLNEIKTCQYKELYAVVKGIVVKLVENETFEFKMDAEDCTAVDEAQSCYTSAVKSCVDPTLKDFITSYYQVIRNETECAKIAPIQTNLLESI